MTKIVLVTAANSHDLDFYRFSLSCENDTDFYFDDKFKKSMPF